MCVALLMPLPVPPCTNSFRSLATFRRPGTKHSFTALRRGYSYAERANPTTSVSHRLFEERRVRRRILIYGGTGYTGRLIAEHARDMRRSPVVAGRTPPPGQGAPRGERAPGRGS